MASSFVAGVGAPRFEPPPSSRLRVLTAASWGRLDGAGTDITDMTSFPADLASELWWRVHARTLGTLTLADRGLAADLLLRLGYPQHAAQVIGLSVMDPAKHTFTPELALEELAVLRCHTPAAAVEDLALRGARSSSLPPSTRRDLALFVVFRSSQDTPTLRAAVALAVNASVELPQSGAAAALARVRLYRAIAVIPLLRQDVRETHRLLGRALECLRSVPAGPGALERLVLADHAYALYCDLVRTHLTFGMAARAVSTAAALVELDPGDDRTWALRGDALVAAGRLDEAAGAYGRGIALGGLGAARAAHCRGVVFDRLGLPENAAGDFELAARIDPTVRTQTSHHTAVSGGSSI